MDLRFHGRSSSTRRVRIVDVPDEPEEEAAGGVELAAISDQNVRRPQRFEDDEEVDELDGLDEEEEDEEEEEDSPQRFRSASPRHKFELDAPVTSSTSKRKRPTGISGRPLGGFVANAYYGRRDAERDQVRDERRVNEAMPKYIESVLKEQRNRMRRRRKVQATCSPIRRVRRFIADPVTRFWLGCNLCCFGSLFLMSFLFMTLLYPTVVRPITRY